MSTITVKDGTTIYYKDWGEGPVVMFSHGWPLCSDAWDSQLHFSLRMDSALSPVTGVVMAAPAKPGAATT